MLEEFAMAVAFPILERPFRSGVQIKVETLPRGLSNIMRPSRPSSRSQLPTQTGVPVETITRSEVWSTARN